MGPEVVLISSAEEAAKDVYATLRADDLLREAPEPPLHEFLCSGDPTSFLALTDRFLGPEAAEVRASSVVPAPIRER
jgi:glutamate racemase